MNPIARGLDLELYSSWTTSRNTHTSKKTAGFFFSHNIKGVYGPCLVIGSRSLIVTG